MKVFFFRVLLHVFDLVVKIMCAKFFQCEPCAKALGDFYDHCFAEPFDSLSED